MNRNKSNGDMAERDLVTFLRANGFPDACRARGEATDFGDLGGIPGVCVQVKRAARESYLMPRLRSAQDGALVQAQGRLPVAVVRLPRVTDPAKWWASVPYHWRSTYSGVVMDCPAWPGVLPDRCTWHTLAEAVDEHGWCLRGDWLVTTAGSLFGALQ